MSLSSLQMSQGVRLGREVVGCQNSLRYRYRCCHDLIDLQLCDNSNHNSYNGIYDMMIWWYLMYIWVLHDVIYTYTCMVVYIIYSLHMCSSLCFPLTEACLAAKRLLAKVLERHRGSDHPGGHPLRREEVVGRSQWSTPCYGGLGNPVAASHGVTCDFWVNTMACFWFMFFVSERKSNLNQTWAK